MQKIPCDVRAYLRFSIFRLQFLHRKHVAQKAWSPVRIARSSILFPQALQLYVQLLQMRDPSPRSRRFASESSKVPQVLHRKQFRCHRLPAETLLALRFNIGGFTVLSLSDRGLRVEISSVVSVVRGFTYQVQKLCPLPESIHQCQYVTLQK